MTKNIKKVTVSFNADDLTAIDDYCICHGLTRSSFITESVLSRIQSEQSVSALRTIACAVTIVGVNKQHLTADQKEVFERACDLIMRGGEFGKL